MNETMANGGSVLTHEEESATRLGQLDDLIDLITNKYILEDCDMWVYSDPMEPWWTVAENGGFGSAEAARESYLSSGSASENSDGTIVVNGTGKGTETFYEIGGEAWNGLRANFETVVPLFEQAMSYDDMAFTGPLYSMQKTRETLTPRADLTEEDVDKLSSLDINEANFTGDAGELLYVDDSWSDATGASENLFAWQGRAAEVFKSAYIERIPAILVGQTMTAGALEVSLSILQSSFRNVRHEASILIHDAGYVFEAVPNHKDVASQETDWKQLLSDVAGVAGFVGGVASVIPGGQVVAAGAGLVGGVATLGSMIVDSPGHQEAVSNPVMLDGDTVEQLYADFKRRIEVYLEQVDNTEIVLTTNLNEFQGLLESSRSTTALTVSLYGVGDMNLTQWNAFFQPKTTADGADLADITDETEYDDVVSGDLVGGGGDVTGADLNALFLAGSQYIPAMADRYASLAGKGYTDGLDLAFSRSMSGYNDAVGEYSANSTGPAFEAWMNVCAIFQEMLTGSATNLDAAGNGLVNAGQIIARMDDEARSGINSSFSDYESLD